MTDSIYQSQNRPINIFIEKYGDDPQWLNNEHFKTDLRELIASYKNAHYRIWQKHLKSIKNEIDDLYEALSFNEKVYLYLNSFTNRPKCKHCQEKYTNFLSIRIGYRDYCSPKCANLSEETQNKVKHQNLEKYGVEWSLSSRDVIEKREQTNLEKYGHVNVLGKGTIVFEKRNNTIKERYGVDTIFASKEIRQKSIETYLAKYGVHNPMLVPEFVDKLMTTLNEKYGGCGLGSSVIKSKIDRTNLEKYGTIHIMQNEDVYNKSETSRLKKRPYFMKSGKEVKIMGYEHFALDILQEIFDEEDIIISRNLPTIYYNFEDQRKRYFPDIYIKSINTIIEVKSGYTLEKYLEKNMMKREATLAAGFAFQFWVFDREGDLIIM